MSGLPIRAHAVIALGGVLLSLAALVMAAGANPAGVVYGILERALFTRAGLLEAVLRTIPLTIMGLGIAIAFRARVFNIGMDGQLIAGAALAVGLAPLLPANTAGMLLFLALGLAGGAALGGVAGLIKARFGGNEIIATIMLNYIAIQILSWLVRGPMQESAGIIPRSDPIDAALRLPVLLAGTRVHGGLLVAVAAVILVALVVGRTRFGFRLDVVGANAHAAHYAGLRPAALAGWALVLSGALAGLAGAVEVAGLYGRLQEGFAPGFGIAAIAVALVARLNPLLVPVSAFGFSLIYVGLGALARNGTVPFPLINVLEGAVILVFLAASLLPRQREGAAHG